MSVFPETRFTGPAMRPQALLPEQRDGAALVVGRGMLWGGLAGLGLGAAAGTALGFVIGAFVGACVGWIVGAVLGLVGGVGAALVPSGPHGMWWARAAGTAPALVVVLICLPSPGSYLIGGAFAAVCGLLGAALGPTVAFGPTSRKTPTGAPWSWPVPPRRVSAATLLGWGARGAGLGIETAVVVAMIGQLVHPSASPLTELAGHAVFTGVVVGLAPGTLLGVLLGALRSNPRQHDIAP